MSGCPPDLALERYHLGEIAGTASAAWVPHIEGCARCQAALEALARDDARPRPPLIGGARPRRWGRWAWAAPALAAAAAGVALVGGRGAPVDSLQLKGSGLLALSVEGEGGWRGAPLAPGTRVQLWWSGARPGFLAVVAVERDGSSSVLYPEGGALAAAVGAGDRVALGGSLVVEARHRGAKLCATFSPTPLPIEAAAVDACRAGRADAVIELEVAE